MPRWFCFHQKKVLQIAKASVYAVEEQENDGIEEQENDGIEEQENDGIEEEEKNSESSADGFDSI